MTQLTSRRMARAFTILTTLLAGAAIAIGCGSDPEGHSIFEGAGGDTAGSGEGQGTGTGATATTGTGAGTTTGTSTGSGAQQASFGVAVDKPTVDMELMSSVDVVVTVTPNGYKGAVTLSVTGLATDVTAKFDDPIAILDGVTPETRKLTLTTLSSTEPGAAPFTVTGAVATGKKTADSTLTVYSTITITIPAGVDSKMGTQANPNKAAFGDYPMIIKAPANISANNPVTVHFYNADTKSHEIHAGQNAQGFPHDLMPIPPNFVDTLVRKVNAKGTYDYYLHDEGAALTVGQIVIQ